MQVNTVLEKYSNPFLATTEVRSIYRCAKTGLFYADIYRKQSKGLLLLVRQEAVEVSPGASTDGQTLTVDLSEATGTRPCFYCKTPPKQLDRTGDLFRSIYCRRCGSFVCLGRTEGRSFQCCEACGNSGTISSESVPHQGEAISPARIPKPSEGPLRLYNNDTLKLGGGKSQITGWWRGHDGIQSGRE